MTGLRIHDLRHTAATLAIRQRANPKAVSARLGHSDVTTTLRLYTHVTPADDQAIADMLGGALAREL